MKKGDKIVRIAFTILLVSAGISYFLRDRIAGVDDIMPECLGEPVQTVPADQAPIRFSRNSYDYEATPLFDYVISGLIVGIRDYDTWYSISKADKDFPLDICIIWGKNLENRIFKNGDIKFSQDFRHCYACWKSDVGFRMEELSNNHLLVESPIVRKRLMKIRNGDQVTIFGKLVNIKAIPVGRRSMGFDHRTSTTRTDTGDGACEIVYVEDVKILKKGNPVFRTIFTLSIWGLMLMAVWRSYRFFTAGNLKRMR